MLNLKKVAITGGISCGKSSVGLILKELGAQFLDADEIVHRLMSPTTTIGQQVIKLLGADIIEDNHINKTTVAKKVFNNPKRLRQLEQLTHPAVKKEIEQYFKQKEQEGFEGIVAVEVPLLYEANFHHLFDKVIAVIAEPVQAEKRYSGEDFSLRVKQQLANEKKAKLADFVIENNSSLADLREAVKAIFLEINN